MRSPGGGELSLSACPGEVESGSERFRVPKTSSQENVLVNDAVPASTKYKNKWAVSIFAEWQRLREVKVPVLDCGGLFKDYDLHKVTALSADIAGMDALSLNYWLSKFVMGVGKFKNCTINVTVSKKE